MRVIFVRDFQGVNTAERFYEAGAVAEFEDEAAARLIAEGAVEHAPEPEPEEPVDEDNEQPDGEQPSESESPAKPTKGKGRSRQAPAES